MNFICLLFNCKELKINNKTNILLHLLIPLVNVQQLSVTRKGKTIKAWQHNEWAKNKYIISLIQDTVTRYYHNPPPSKKPYCHHFIDWKLLVAEENWIVWISIPMYNTTITITVFLMYILYILEYHLILTRMAQSTGAAER